jgi:hypothetical protein
LEKKYPEALHLYRISYTDDTSSVLYACGSTNAVYISKAKWPHLEITSVEILDDSWKK